MDWSVDSMEEAFENAPVGLIIVDEQDKIRYANERFYRIFRLPEYNSTVIGKDHYSVIKSQVESTESNVNRTFFSNQSCGIEETLRLNDGKVVHRTASSLEAEELQDAVLWVYKDITQKDTANDQLEDLHHGMKKMMMADSKDEIYQILLDILAESFGIDVSGLWEYDVEEDALTPVIVSDKVKEIIGEPPSFYRDEGLIWDAFMKGEMKIYSNLEQVSGKYNRDTPLQSEIITPITGKVVLMTGSNEESSFCNFDIQLIQMLADVTQDALYRMRKEQDLKLTRQVLNRLLRHNTRQLVNILYGEASRLDKQEVDQTDVGENIKEIGDKISDLSQKSARLQEIINGRGEQERANISELLYLAAEEVEGDDADISITGNHKLYSFVHPRLHLGLKNLIKNGIQHNDSENPQVDIHVEKVKHGTRIEIKDYGPGIPQTEIDALLQGKEDRFTHSLGLGLWMAYFTIEYSDGVMSFETGDKDDEYGTKVEITIAENRKMPQYKFREIKFI